MNSDIDNFLRRLALTKCPEPGENAPYRVGHAGKSIGYSWSFSGFSARDFETLCFNIIRARHGTAGAQYYLGGSEQPGMDIYAWDAAQPAKLRAYECKHRSDEGQIGHNPFTISEIDEAVDRFLEKGPIALCSSFTIITATELQNAARTHIQAIRDRLRSEHNGVEFDVWTREHLWSELAKLPDVAGRFIRENEYRDLAAHYDRHARRMAAIWQEEAIRTDQAVQARLASIARTRVACTPEVYDDGNSYRWSDGLISLSAMLPRLDRAASGCIISILAPGHDNAIIEVSHDQVLTRLWPRHGIPYGQCERPLLTGPNKSLGDQVTLKFDGAKIFVPENVAQSLVHAVDAFTPRYLKALESLETALGAERFYFQYEGDRYPTVVLGSIEEALWRKIIEFAYAHDAAHAPPERLSFDAVGGMLKPYTKSTGPTLDDGYHAMISPAEEPGSGSIKLMWDALGIRVNEQLSPRGYWNCETTFDWLRHELILAVVASRKRQRWWKTWSKMGRADPSADLTDHRSPDLRALAGQTDQESLTALIGHLQYIYHSPGYGDPVLIPDVIFVMLLRGAVTATQEAKPTYVGYAASHLFLSGDNVEDGPRLCRAIDRKLSTPRPNYHSSRIIDHALRAILDILHHGKPLSPSAVSQLLACIAPLIPKALEISLVRRHGGADD